jgi:hypothetical protein
LQVGNAVAKFSRPARPAGPRFYRPNRVTDVFAGAHSFLLVLVTTMLEDAICYDGLQEIDSGDHFGNETDLRKTCAHCHGRMLAATVFLLRLGPWKRRSRVVGRLSGLGMDDVMARLASEGRTWQLGRIRAGEGKEME